MAFALKSKSQGKAQGAEKSAPKRKSARGQHSADSWPGNLPPIVREVLRSPGQPLDPATQAFMEPRFGQDFSQVRVHADAKAAESARAVDALAYTVGRNIVFSDGPHTINMRQRPTLLAHELAHVIQQGRGGVAPALNPVAMHEREAEAAAKSVVNSEGPVTVSGATGVGLARTPLDLTQTDDLLDLSDWMNRTPDLSDINVWSDARLVGKLEEVEQWRSRQTSSSPKSLLADSAAAQLRNEIDRRAAVGEAEATLAGMNRTMLEEEEEKEKEEAREAARQPRPTSQLLTSDEMCAGRCFNVKEFVKEIEEANESFADPKTQWLGIFRRIDRIVPLKHHPGYNKLEYGGEKIVLTDAEVAALRANARAMLDEKAKKARNKNEDTFEYINDYMEHWRKQPNFITSSVSKVSGVRPDELEDRVSNLLTNSNMLITSYRQRDPRAGDVPLAKQAEVVLEAVDLSERAREWYDIGDQSATEAAGSIVKWLERTKTGAYLIVLAGTGFAAAPVVSAGVLGAGFTGATAAGLTTLGTAGVVGAEGFILGGGSAMLGEAVAGHSWEDVKAAGWREGKRWGETGAKIGAATGLAPAVGKVFGASAQGISRTSRFVRSGLAAGVTNTGIEFVAEAAHGRVIDPRFAAGIFVGSFAGGGFGSLTNTIMNPLIRGVAQVAVGSGSGGLAAYVATGDINQASESAALGGVTVLALGRQAQPQAPTRGQQKAFAVGQAGRRFLVDTRDMLKGGMRKIAMSTFLGTAKTPSFSGDPGSPNIVQIGSLASSALNTPNLTPVAPLATNAPTPAVTATTPSHQAVGTTGQRLAPIQGAQEVRVTPQQYQVALGHTFPSHSLDFAYSLADSIGQQAARLALANPRFVAAVQNRNTTLAGTFFHSAAATVVRGLPASAVPAGWRLQAELTIQAGRGGSRADILLSGPNREIFEFDWKTRGRSALSTGSRSEMRRHAGQITANIGGNLTRQESRSWIDFVRTLWPNAPWP